jgi:2-hydroxychromene-2-carboxylate isomerase
VRVQLWFDPACPFCWVTSRWLVHVARLRELTIDWQPISLLLKNAPGPDSPFFAASTASHGLLRLVQSVRSAGHEGRIGELYRAFGLALHVRGERTVDVPAVLEQLGIDAAHAEAVDDPTFDAAIRAAMDDGLALVGDDVGTPIIAVDRGDLGGPAGERIGLFGPVITRLPEDDAAALRLWDGFLAMAATDGFFELKRTRSERPQRVPEDRA